MDPLRLQSIQMGASGTAILAAGGSSFTLRPETLDSLGLAFSELAVGSALDEEAAALVSLAAEALEAEKRGLSLLARAEQSAFMLRLKLESREFSRRAVGLALDRLQAEGILDDRRFAAAFAASRLSRKGSKAEGPSSLVSELRKRGVDRSLAAEVVAELLGPGERTEALRKAAKKAEKKSGGDRDELKRRLRGLGFKSEEIGDFFDSEENHP